MFIFYPSINLPTSAPSNFSFRKKRPTILLSHFFNKTSTITFYLCHFEHKKNPIICVVIFFLKKARVTKSLKFFSSGFVLIIGDTHIYYVCWADPYTSLKLSFLVSAWLFLHECRSSVLPWHSLHISISYPHVLASSGHQPVLSIRIYASLRPGAEPLCLSICNWLCQIRGA